MRKLLLSICLLLLLIIGVMVYNFSANLPPLTNSAPVTLVTPTPAPWQPARLVIPALHIDAPVMAVGATTNGVMDAPTSKAVHSTYWSSVFWYDLGAAPGQNGNAVIAGHVNRVGGDPAIFWTLSSLVPGETFTVVTSDGHSLHFVVNRVVAYPANAPSKQTISAVFGPTTGHHLNLITCSGVWTGNGYDQRLVVFTTQTS
jgi:Sortase domain